MKKTQVLQWVGGKSRFASKIVNHFPGDITVYCEPCIGSGSILFEAIEQGKLRKGAIVRICDCPEIVNLFRTMAYHSPELCDRITGPYGRMTSEEAFDFAKSAINSNSTQSIDRAAALIVLNKLSFNALYRVNRKGQYNVARDPDKKLKVDTVIGSISRAVNLLIHSSFIDALQEPSEVIYSDPPYVGVFTSYTSTPFNFADQATLVQLLNRQRELGAFVVASNSDHPDVHALYADERWEKHTLERDNRITCDASTRSRKVSELLMIAR
jgi:DNA adenine methylase